MWKLEQISAKNLCAFKQLDYSIRQNRTTLIFGNNLDNDSQASNGSGKSALIEAIAIGLTGEPLRNIKRDEIINDMANEAVVSLVLTNYELGERMTINRRLSRNQPQQIQVVKQFGKYDTDVEEVIQSSVADYNKYVLDAIGLTKEDIYSNFILSKHKYTSFLSSSDKDKKEIINRFSNGILVDESIAALQNDMAPVQEDLKAAENEVAMASGKVSAINEQINTELAEATEKSQNKTKRIAELKDKITEKREYIREQNEKKRNADARLDVLDNIDQTVQGLEKSKKTIAEAQSEINTLFSDNKLNELYDFVGGVQELNEKLTSLQTKHTQLSQQAASKDAELKESTSTFVSLQKKYNAFTESYGPQSVALRNDMQKLADSVNQLAKDNDKLSKERQSIERKIASLQAQLAGVIVCPKCNHEFTLAGDIAIEEARKDITDKQATLKTVQDKVNANNSKSEELTLQGRDKRKEYDDLAAKKSQMSEEVANAQSTVNHIQASINSIDSLILSVAGDIEKMQKRIDNTRTELFDQAFEIIDTAIKTCESSISNANINISNANGNIESYEEAIKETEESSATDLIDNLKASKARYELALNKAIAHQEEVGRLLADYKSQESTFIEFKTHLANTKINDLSRITNEFLEKIGSDIRIAFSGYTVLKSGKIRDKISISLIRDGVDCGSFDKFSEGEKARVNLANILAMHKLTNVNCVEDKGLDLLVLDEILDATDESGLANIFEALNSLQITSLVVSHGNIAENYPYKLIVNKQNGVSFINEESK